MFAGILFAVTACLVWGLGFAAPLFAPDFTPAQLSAARFIVFGGFSAALCLRWRPPPLRHPLWRQAVLGSVSGNLLYYLCLVGGIRLIGVSRLLCSKNRLIWLLSLTTSTRIENRII